MKITASEFHQLLGLCTVTHEHHKIDDACYKAFGEILGKEHEDWFYDIAFDDNPADKLRTVLKQEGFTIVPK